MTKQELNRDIKKLSSEIYRMSFGDREEYLTYIDTVAKKEFLRLHDADAEGEYMTKDSILRMLHINHLWAFIPGHNFLGANKLV